MDISSLIPKITEVVGHLDDAQGSLDELSEQGMFKMWWGSFTGGNDKVLANAEKTLIESSKMNIGLAMLTTMYAKVIKDQQNVLQQRELKEQNDAIREQQEHIEQLPVRLIFDQHHKPLKPLAPKVFWFCYVRRKNDYTKYQTRALKLFPSAAY